MVGIGLFIFYYMPYSYYLELSYWEFRKICKLNELPNNEEKYNKILAYFDTDLDSLDWKELNHDTQIAYNSRVMIDYRAKTINYSPNIPKNKGRLGYNYAFLYPNSKERFSKQKLPLIWVLATWHTKRYYPTGNEGSMDFWDENILTCIDMGAEIQYIKEQ
ncbi:hypothetical protein [Campylobacter helveticus]|uniref:hypothetical protein n=1 Tax=Campylobacter helveticus TaxID=28898 RepID=UPI001115B914|nr:hypothetical protein FDW46_09450 [Campylobacter helveticus]TNH34232.1 hypothetical protein FDW45_09105 [Campylobacter helveticus]